MSLKYVLSLFAAALVGFTISPSYSQDIISCNGFEDCKANDPALEARVAALEALLADVSRGTDANTGQDTLRFADMNVQVVNGAGTTGGAPTGTGNLIIGYNELREVDPNLRSGSHMLVIGGQNNYTSYGGMVAGITNTASEEYASVNGGQNNTASGFAASVSGGLVNTADHPYSSVSGGKNNTAVDDYASISGGRNNAASGVGASVSGGDGNVADGSWASVSGGTGKNALGLKCWEGDSTEDC